MNLGITTAVLVSALALPGYSAEVTESVPTTLPASSASSSAPMINSKTIGAATELAPGDYTAIIAPNINDDMAKRVEEVMKPMRGVKDAKVKTLDSSLHFTITKGAHVKVADLQKAIAKSYTGAVLSTPILENSLSANPGL